MGLQVAAFSTGVTAVTLNLKTFPDSNCQDDAAIDGSLPDFYPIDECQAIGVNSSDVWTKKSQRWTIKDGELVKSEYKDSQSCGGAAEKKYALTCSNACLKFPAGLEMIGQHTHYKLTGDCKSDAWDETKLRMLTGTNGTNGTSGTNGTNGNSSGAGAGTNGTSGTNGTNGNSSGAGTNGTNGTDTTAGNIDS